MGNLCFCPYSENTWIQKEMDDLPPKPRAREEESGTLVTQIIPARSEFTSPVSYFAFADTIDEKV